MQIVYNLDRFVAAQRLTIGQALIELRQGRKQSHWMWFVFPQLKGLGHSATALQFGISSLDEARAYLAHPVLGTRLVECTRAVLDRPNTSLHEIFGAPDDLKFRSCMTLFTEAAAEPNSIFHRALAQCCGGNADPRTLALLAHL